jgi:hypothetical protein
MNSAIQGRIVLSNLVGCNNNAAHDSQSLDLRVLGLAVFFVSVTLFLKGVRSWRQLSQ